MESNELRILLQAVVQRLDVIVQQNERMLEEVEEIEETDKDENKEEGTTSKKFENKPFKE